MRSAGLVVFQTRGFSCCWQYRRSPPEATPQVSERRRALRYALNPILRVKRQAQRLGVPVVPSVDIFHYAGLDDHFKAAESDIRRLRQLGVAEFLIDSVYDPWLRE